MRRLLTLALLLFGGIAQADMFTGPGAALPATGAGSVLAGPAYSGGILDCFGDSFANGLVNGVVDPTNGYCYVLARETGATLIKEAFNGAASDNESTLQAMEKVVLPTSIAVSDIGSSEYVHYTSGLAADFVSYNALVQASLAWLAIPDVQKIKASNALISYGGTWANGTGGTTYGFTTKYAVTVGATATVAVSGEAVYIWYDQWITSGNMGAATVTIDGTVYGTISATGHRVSNPDQTTNFFRAEMFRVGGLPPGTHTVVLTTTAPTDGTHYFELLAVAGAGTYTPSTGTPGMASGPIVFQNNGQRLNAAGYAFYSTTEALSLKFNDILAQIVRTLAGDGLRIQWVNSQDAYDPLSTSCGISPDNVHPSICGHRRIADAFEVEMNQAQNAGKPNPVWNVQTGYMPYNLSAGSIPKTAAYTARLPDDVVLGDPTAGGFTISLPTAVGVPGKQFTFVNVRTSGTNTLTIGTQFSQVFSPVGGGTFALTQQGQLISIVSDGANWRIVNQYIPTQIDGVLSLTAEVSVNNSTADTVVLTYPIPADTSNVGTTYRFRVIGNADNLAAGQSINMWFKDNGGTKRATFTFASPASGQTNKGWTCDVYLTIRTIGAGGTMIVGGDCSSETPTFGAASFVKQVPTATFAINTTAASSITFGMNNGTGASGDIMRAEIGSLTREKL